MTAVTTANGTEPVGHGHPAGIVSRGLAAVVDVAAIFILQVLIYAGAAAVRYIWSPNSFEAPGTGPLALLSSSAGLTVVYLTIGWATAGQTYGAAVLGIRVVDPLGRVPGWGRAAVRAVCCLAFPVGLLWAAVSTERRSVQNLLLRTNVVYDRHRS